MAPLSDKDRLKAYRDALRNWALNEYITFQLHEEAQRYLRVELGITQRELCPLMFEYVNEGGVIDEQRETREPWSDEFEFHHDLRFTINDRHVYIETCLSYRLPFKADESSIIVVNIHDK